MVQFMKLLLYDNCTYEDIMENYMAKVDNRDQCEMDY